MYNVYMYMYVQCVVRDFCTMCSACTVHAYMCEHIFYVHGYTWIYVKYFAVPYSYSTYVHV